MHEARETIAAIDKVVQDAEEEPHRRHLGASIIGDECARKLWYLFRWTLAERFESRMLRLFNRGHLEEKRFVGWLRDAGVQIWEVNPETAEQWRISDVDGHFGGSLDAVGMGLPDLPPNIPFLCEFKTHNAKSFAKLKAEGIQRTKWKHFVQMQVYMHKMDLPWAAYFAVNKDDDDLFVQLVRRDDNEAFRALERAKTVIYASEPLPRIGASPAAWQCKFCHLARLCHFGDVQPERNCRTCKHALPGTHGLWLCMNHLNSGKGQLDEAAQRAGCECYEVNPVLLGRQP